MNKRPVERRPTQKSTAIEQKNGKWAPMDAFHEAHRESSNKPNKAGRPTMANLILISFYTVLMCSKSLKNPNLILLLMLRTAFVTQSGLEGAKGLRFSPSF